MSPAGTIRLPGWRRPAALPKILPDCVLLVPTFQRPREMVTLLDRLAEVPDPPGAVLVVDGSPDDATRDAIAAWSRPNGLPFDLAVVRSPAGLTRQRNVGLDASDEAFVYFLDDDCLPEPGYFAAIRRVFEADREPSIGGVCGSLVNEMGRPLSRRWQMRFRLGLVPRDGRPGTYYPTATSVPRGLAQPFSGIRAVDLVPGGAVAWRREVFASQRFSLFFDGYAQGEDVEMSRRVARSWRLVWCGDAHVNHFHAPSGRPSSFAKGRMEVRNRFFIRERHSGDASLRERARFWLDIGYVFAWDFVYLIARKPPGGHLEHAAGVASGGLSCFLDPPRYEEPEPRKEYTVGWAPMPERAHGGEGAP